MRRHYDFDGEEEDDEMMLDEEDFEKYRHLYEGFDGKKKGSGRGYADKYRNN